MVRLGELPLTINSLALKYNIRNSELVMKEKYKRIICNRIKFLLKERNLTAESLAYQSGISKGCMSEILNCKKSPSSFTIAKICSGLNISLDDFYADKNIRDFVEQL